MLLLTPCLFLFCADEYASCLNETGSKEIPLKTTGHEKVRVSVCLAAKGDGTKLKPFIDFAGAKRESVSELEILLSKECLVCTLFDKSVFFKNKIPVFEIKKNTHNTT